MRGILRCIGIAIMTYIIIFIFALSEVFFEDRETVINGILLIGYIVSFILVYVLFRKQTLTWKIYSDGNYGESLLVSVGFAVAYAFLAFSLVCVVSGQYSATEQIKEIGIVSFLLQVISITIAVPMIEELLFRGFLFDAIKINNIFIKVIICSLLFAIAHWDVQQSIVCFFLAIFLCIIRQVYNSLWLCILTHGIYNAVIYSLCFFSFSRKIMMAVLGCSIVLVLLLLFLVIFITNRFEYSLFPTTKLINIGKIPVITNLSNGSCIGLDEKGKEFFLTIINNEKKRFLSLSSEERKMVRFALENEIIQRHNKPQTIDRRAYLHITSRCNFHCIGCYSYESERNKKVDLSVNEVKQIIDKMRDANVHHIIISGGEPFIREDIFTILRYAKRRIEKITVATNGSFITERIAKKIKNLGVTVALAIDGYSSEQSHFLRDEGAFNIALKALNCFRKESADVYFVATIHKQNYKHSNEYLKLASDYSTPIVFSILSCKANDEWLGKYVLTPDEFTCFCKNCSEENVPSFSIEDIPNIEDELQLHSTCGAGDGFFSVDAYGNVYPCHMLMNKKFLLGNILKQSVDECLKNNMLPREIAECEKCDYKYICHQGCYARKYFFGLKMENKDPFCSTYTNLYKGTIDKVNNLAEKGE